MQPTVHAKPPDTQTPDPKEAWEMVVGMLRADMSRATFETWVAPLKPVGYRDGVFTLGARNAFARDWVEHRLKSRITRLLEGLFNREINLRLVVTNGFAGSAAERADLPVVDATAEPAGEEAPPADLRPESRSRKLMLQRAYGSKRASVIQPERGMFLTLYFFYNWTPLIGHSAAAVILAARSMCYWNPMTGELRNTIETEMSELAKRASVSVRTVKDVLNNELVKRYFLRYTVRRVMTPNGVRTAGLHLQVRMDDPLTPEDQQEHTLDEDDRWWSREFGLFDSE